MTDVKQLPEVKTDAPRGSVQWLIAQLNNHDDIDVMVAATLAAQQERIEALEAALSTFAFAADGRRRKDIRGAVCFTQGELLKARAALKGGQ